MDLWIRLDRPPGAAPTAVRLSAWDSAFPAVDAPPAVAADLDYAVLDAAGPPTVAEVRETLQDPAAASATAQAIGEALYTWLTASAVGPLFSKLAAAGAPRRIWFDCRTRDLADLPWESIAQPDPLGGLADFLALRPGWSVVRGAGARGATAPADPSLRVLVLFGNEVLHPADAFSPEILADHDAVVVEKAFQGADWSAHVDVARPPANLAALGAVLHDAKPHVLHFIGHGGLWDQTNKSALYFLLGSLDVWGWDINDVGVDLAAQGAVPRLVMLNACASGQSMSNASSLSHAFVRAGAVAVVGMLAEVQANHAIAFSESVYAALAAGEPIDAAVTKGRLAIRAKSQLQARDWLLPTLTLSVPPEEVLPSVRYQARVRDCEVRREIVEVSGPFVDRCVERRRIVRELLPLGPAAPVRGLLVRGLPDAGKSWLVKRGLAELAQAGFDARYCELQDSGGGLDAAGVLARIRRGRDRPASFLFSPLPDEDFKEYDAAAAAHQARLAAGGRDGLAAADVDALFESFRRGLAALSARGPGFVLVLDQFSRETGGSFPREEFTDQLYPGLVKPILQDQVGRTTIVLVMRLHEDHAYGLTEPGGAVVPGLRPLDVPLFGKAIAKRIFLEFCHFESSPRLENLCTVFLDDLETDPWPPSQLAEFRPFVARARAKRD